MNWRNIALPILLMVLISVFFFLAFCLPSHAKIYFCYDAESGTVGSNIPYSQLSGPEFYGSPGGTIRNSPLTAPQGTKYFAWEIAQDKKDIYTEVRDKVNMPFILTMGTTYYMAYFFNYTEINGLEVYHTEPDTQCADKGEEMVGNGLRWCVSKGVWDTASQKVPSHKWTIWLGNPSYHLNPELEPWDIYSPNAGGYNGTKWPMLEASRWYAVVLAVKMAQDRTGSVTLYLNGVKIDDYKNIQTVAAGVTPTIDRITMHGTLCQPTYNTAAHVKNYDAMILTDNWEDIVNGGYLSGKNPPSPPIGVKILRGQ